MTLLTWVGVALLGGASACLRFWLDGAVVARVGRGFPYGTLAVNASGALVLGVLSGAALSSNAYLLAGTATVGSYTTFSTWMLETQRLGEAGRPRWALANVVVSLALGIGAVALGRAL